MHKTKELLMEKAVDLFRKYGYDNVTIDQICKACDVTKGSFYHHFANKSDILLCYYSKTHASVLPVFKNLVTIKSAYDQLWEIIIYAVDKNTDEIGPDIFKEVLLAEISTDISFFDSKHVVSGDITAEEDYTELLISLIEKGQKDNTIRSNVKAQDLYKTYRLAEKSSAIKWSLLKGNYDRAEEIKIIFETIFKPQ